MRNVRLMDVGCWGVVGLLLLLVMGGWARGQAVYVEDSPAAMALAERARQWREQGRLSDAVGALLELSETYGGKLMPVEQGRYVDAAWWVRRELGEDAALRAAYEREAEPAAARALEEAMGRTGAGWYDADALAAVGRRYWLTPSGLAANLAWSAVMLERGEAAAALGVLDQLEDHPLAAASAARRSALRGSAEGLQALLAEAARRRGAGMPTAGAGVGVGGGGAAGLGASLWTVWWNDLVGAEGGAMVSMGPRQRGRRSGLAGVTAWGVQPTAVLTAGQVWVTDGVRVACLDRASGRVRWAFAWPGLSSGSLQMGGQTLPDRRGVLVGGGRAWVVLGPGRVRGPGRRGPRAVLGDQGLWCLDEATGEALWSVVPSGLEQGWESAQFMGTAVLAGPGVVAVRVRRVQMSGFVDSFVVGLDAGTGAFLWKRHLGSTSNAGVGGALPPAWPMVEAGGRLLVDEGLGVAAALDPCDGGVWWLRKTLVAPGLGEEEEKQEEAVRGRRPVMASVQGQAGPVAVASGVLVAVVSSAAGGGMGGMGGGQAWGQGAWLLDAATGKIKGELTAEDAPWVRGGVWGGDGKGGLLVNADGALWRIDGQTLEAAWKTDPPGASLHNAAFPPVFDGTDAIVTGDGRAVRIALSTGKAERPIDWPTGAALAMGRGEAVSVTTQAINGYVLVEQGHRRLKQRIASSPDDPEPGLALATLGVRAERSALLLEGASAALRAIKADEDRAEVSAGLDEDAVTALLESVGGGARAAAPRVPAGGAERSAEERNAAGVSDRGVSVVLELIQLAASAQGLPTSVRREVFDKVATSVTGPGELVAYHLALGPLEQEAGDFGEAAAHYQAVLRDPLLSGQVVEVAGSHRRAGIEARQKLTELVARVGFEVYEPFEQEAQRELDRLTRDPQTTPGQLAALADRFPLAEASAKALLASAAQLVSADRGRVAIGPLRRAYRIARLPQTRAAAVGGLAGLYERQGRPGTARAWLERVARDHPALAPLRDGVPVPAAQWVADLKTLADAADGLPVFDPASAPQPWVVPAALMPIAPSASATHRRDRAVMRSGARVLVYDLGTRALLLSQTLPARDAVVLRFSDDQLVLFSSQQGAVYTLDLDAPKQDAPFKTLSLDELLATVGDAAPAQAGNEDLRVFEARLNMEQQNRFIHNRAGNPQNQNRRRFVVASDTTLVLADNTGRVIALDRLTLDPQWTYRSPVAATSGLTADDETAVLVGLTAPGTDAQASTILALDLITGQPRGAPILEDSNPPLDARPMPDGTLLVTFPTFVCSYTLDDTQLLWRSPRPFDIQTPFFPPPAAGDGVLAMTFPSATPTVLILDPTTGQTHARLTLDRRANAPITPRQRLIATDGRLHILADQPACYTDEGRLLWRSALDDPQALSLFHTLADDHVLVLTQQTHTPSAARYGLDFYQRDTGVLVAQHLLSLTPGTTIIAPMSRLYDHAIAFSSAAKTTFFFDAAP